MSDSLNLDNEAQTIIFNEIPAALRDPGARVEVRPNYGAVGLLQLPSKAIVIAPMLPPLPGSPPGRGAAVPGQVYPITGGGQAEYLFGSGSIATCMINVWRLNNTSTPLFAVGVLDLIGATSASAQGEIAPVAFPNGYSGTLLVNGVSLPVAIPPGTTQADLAAAFVAAINGSTVVPVTAGVVPGSPNNFTILAWNAGVYGNGIPVRWLPGAAAPVVEVSIDLTIQGNPAGVLKGGLGTPDIGPVLTAIAATWYTDIVTPFTDAANRAEQAADGVRRYGAMVNLDARYWGGIAGSYATVVNYGDAGNSIQMITVGVRTPKEAPWMWAAAWGAVHAFRLANDPSRQSKSIAVVGLTAPEPGDAWSPQERDLLLNNGISTWTALPDGTVVISRTITGYLVSNDGVVDAAWLDVMTPATATAIRYDWKAYATLRYPNAKLFDDDSIGASYDDNAATPKRMRGSWAGRCRIYEQVGWIEGSATTVQQGYFVRNVANKNRLDVDVTVRIAGNLINLDTVLEFAA